MQQSDQDTSPEIDRMQVEGLRRMPIGRKAEIIWGLCSFARKLALADARRRYPDADDRECLLRVASYTLDRDLMIRAVGWDPLEKGF